MNLQLIILAAGKGTRMQSDLPKVMHMVGGKSMLERVIDTCAAITDDIIVVYSDHLEPYLDQFSGRCKFVRQDNQLGTAHAVWVAKENFAQEKLIGVMYGDNPLITSEIIMSLFRHMQEQGAAATTLAFDCLAVNQYGRIITDSSGNFMKIVEAKFASPDELAVTLCNSGVMGFAPKILNQYIDRVVVPRNIDDTRELYLTDIVEICVSDGRKVVFYKALESELVIGVNTKEELSLANSMLK